MEKIILIELPDNVFAVQKNWKLIIPWKMDKKHFIIAEPDSDTKLDD